MTHRTANCWTVPQQFWLIVSCLLLVLETSALTLRLTLRGHTRGILAPPSLLQQRQDPTKPAKTSHPFASSVTKMYNSNDNCDLTPSSGSSGSSGSSSSSKKKKVGVLVCPAQFCVPADYECLKEQLMKLVPDLHTFAVAPLPRTEWIKVARQLPTAAFVQAKLPVEQTLSWYFDAIEEGLADIFASCGGGDDANVKICIIGHSIGGWVARAYLGGLALSSTATHRLALQRVSSLVTLGTPHLSSATALVDQTRGLLAAIEASPSCQPQALMDVGDMEITCVCASGVRGNFWTTNVEEIVAASSYWPLTGKVNNVYGDGIVPLDLAFLQAPARRLELTNCTLTQQPIRHSHVVPTPWNLWNGYQPSIGLPVDEYPSYVSEGVVHQWAQYVR